ncbi:MAG: hypothetical protein V1701_04080, partial [Planctomycetota bacterium]
NMRKWQWAIVLCVPFFAFILSGCPWADEDDYISTGSSTTAGGVLAGVGSWQSVAPWKSNDTIQYWWQFSPTIGTFVIITTITPGVLLLAGREQHTMVWTYPGTPRFIIWGGRGVGGYLNSGAVWNQQTKVWSGTPVPFTGGWGAGGFGLSARIGHTAVWDGQNKIIFGGQDTSGTILNGGAMYDPSGNNWIYITSPTWIFSRVGHTANWNGTRMLVFGGYGSTSAGWWGQPTTSTYLSDLQIYNPTLNTWAPGSISSQPTPRWNHTSVWTGTELIVWGGSSSTYLNNGRRYNYSTDNWTDVAINRAPAAREGHTAVFTGNGNNAWNNKMIVWGGGNPRPMNSGGIYDIALDQWLPVTDGVLAPISRTNHTAIWTSLQLDEDPLDTNKIRKMIIWGGTDTAGNQLNSGGIYDPLTNTWEVTQIVTSPPTARRLHTAVWTGTTMIILGGFDGAGYLADTWIYTPSAR